MGFDLSKRAYVLGTSLDALRTVGRHASFAGHRAAGFRRQRGNQPGCRLAVDPGLSQLLEFRTQAGLRLSRWGRPQSRSSFAAAIASRTTPSHSKIVLQHPAERRTGIGQLPEQRVEYVSFAGRSAELWITQRSAVRRRARIRPSSIINLNDTRLITPGFSAYFLDPHHGRSACAGLELHHRERDHGEYHRARHLPGQPCVAHASADRLQ